jgi:protoporphyrinogen oxidase
MGATSVGIVGGGPGGLFCAYQLQKWAARPLSIALFEAASRVGGKILTPCFSTGSVRYEAGAAEFYDYSQFEPDPLRELVRELGLSVRPMGGSAVLFNGRLVANADDMRREFGAGVGNEVRDFDRRAKDAISPQEFFHADDPEGAASPGSTRRFSSALERFREPLSRRFIETLVHSDLATEPERTSVRYGLHNYLMNDPAYMGLYSIDGGNERLPRELAARLAAKIHLQRRATRVESTGTGRLRVRRQSPDGEEASELDFVVIALPHNQLRTLSYGDPGLAAAMREHEATYDHPAHYLRITLLFERPYWRRVFRDSFWMLDCFGGCCLYDESSREPESRQGVLGWLIAGEAARQMSGHDDRSLVEQVLAALPECLRTSSSAVLDARVHRWPGAVSALPAGWVPRSHDRRHQPDPRGHPQLFVVGDYLFDSTLNGVFDSADCVARWIAALTA